MENKLFIPVLLGKIRKNSMSGLVANYLMKMLEKENGVETTLINPIEMNLPLDDEDSFKDKNPEYQKIIGRSDGLIIVIPEYNHSFPGSLKMVLDILTVEYEHKAVGLCGVSTGTFGGVHGVKSLLPVLRTFGLVSSSVDLFFPKVKDKFNANGDFIDQTYEERSRKFFNELFWIARALKKGREATV